jgi:hypothetical protein
MSFAGPGNTCWVVTLAKNRGLDVWFASRRCYSELFIAALRYVTLHIVEGGHNICFASIAPVAINIENWT